MIPPDEIEAAALRYGTPDSQVVRDHLISHVLAALGDLPADHLEHLRFFGGTALCRTWCPNLRLSEDIDLMIDAPDRIEIVEQHLSRRLRREFPGHTWIRESVQHDVDTRLLDHRTSTVRVQYVWGRPGWQQIPTGPALVDLRFSDLAGTTSLNVPTASGFSAMKLMAWFDRAAPRDLFDLAALARAGHVDRETTQLVKDIAGYRPTQSLLGTRVPRRVAQAWYAELQHQVADAMSPETCLEAVGEALAHVHADTDDD